MGRKSRRTDYFSFDQWGGEVCPTCGQEIDDSNFDLHTIRCQKYNWKCPECGEVLPKDRSRIEHHQATHQPVECPDCHQIIEQSQLIEHLQTECPRRLVSCDLCEEMFPAEDLAEHFASEMAEREYAMGKTEQCPHCKKWIQLRYLEDHLEKHETGELPSSPTETTATSMAEVYPCPTCGVEFEDYDMMVAHRMEQHDEEPELFPCPHCGRIYLTPEDRDLHIRLQETDTSATE